MEVAKRNRSWEELWENDAQKRAKMAANERKEIESGDGK